MEIHKIKLWFGFIATGLLIVPTFITWIKVNQKMKQITKRIETYKNQIKNLENSIR